MQALDRLWEQTSELVYGTRVYCQPRFVHEYETRGLRYDLIVDLLKVLHASDYNENGNRPCDIAYEYALKAFEKVIYDELGDVVNRYIGVKQDDGLLKRIEQDACYAAPYMKLEGNPTNWSAWLHSWWRENGRMVLNEYYELKKEKLAEEIEKFVCEYV